MAYPQGFLFQPSVSLALHSCPTFTPRMLLGPRTEELGRSSTGSAFAPYAGSAGFNSSSPGFNSHLQYSGEPRTAAALNSFVGSAYDPSSGISGSLEYHPFGGALGPYAYGDPAYRKNATRDATATLKAWLNEHRKNPYPTKGEKIMLAIITKMTLTQVSTWFANARRRLKKENKMTWTPRNRSEDEEEDDNIDLERNDEDEEPLKQPEETESKETVGHHPNPGQIASEKHQEDSNTDHVAAKDSDLKDHGEGKQSERLGSVSESPQTVQLGMERISESLSAASQSPRQVTFDPIPSNAASVIHTPPSAPKPKLWSLAEIATSSDKCKGMSDSSQTVGIGHGADITVRAASPSRAFPHSAALSRQVYYTSPGLFRGYSNYGGFGHLHSDPGQTAPTATQLHGLHQTMLQRAEAIARESKVRSQTHFDICKDFTYELKKGMANI